MIAEKDLDGGLLIDIEANFLQIQKLTIADPQSDGAINTGSGLKTILLFEKVRHIVEETKNRDPNLPLSPDILVAASLLENDQDP